MGNSRRTLFIVVMLVCLFGAGAYAFLKWYPIYSAQSDLKKLGITFSEQQFIEHSCAGDTGTVLLFFRAGMNINIAAVPSNRGPVARTALQCAIMSGHLDTATALVQMGADVNLADSEGATPLYYLAKYPRYPADMSGRLAYAQLLIAKGADVNASGKWGTPLIGAVQSNSIEISNLLLKQGADVNAVTSDGNTAVMELTKNSRFSQGGNMDLIEALVDKGANINAVSKSGNTAILYAAQRRDKEAVSYLISKGADLNQPAGSAAKLLQAALYDPDLVTLLLQGGVDINTRISEGTLLHYFIDRRNEAATQALLSHKDLDINAVDSRGDTPLHIAAYRNNGPLIRQLIEGGGNPNSRNLSMQTPLMKAVTGLAVEAVEELIRDGVDVNATDNNGRTVLYYANQGGGDVFINYAQRAATSDRAAISRSAISLNVTAASSGLTPPSPPTAVDRAKIRDTIVSMLRKHGAR